MKTDREKALKWWWNELNAPDCQKLMNKYQSLLNFGITIIPDVIEIIWKKEIQQNQVNFEHLKKDIKFFIFNDEVKGYFGKKGSENLLLFFELMSKSSTFAHKAHKELNKLK